jgi:hypothetical protein
MRGLGVIDSAGGYSAEDSSVEIRHLFSGNRPPGHVLTGLQLHYLPLSSSSYFLLFTSTVYFYCLLLLSTSRFYFYCVCGVIVFPSARVDDRNLVAVHSFNVASYDRASPGCPIFEAQVLTVIAVSRIPLWLP